VTPATLRFRPLAKPQCPICANMQTLYETFGIPKTPKPEQIKRAYRMLVKRFHPDLFHSDRTRKLKQKCESDRSTQHTEFFQIRKNGQPTTRKEQSRSRLARSRNRNIV